MKPENTFLWTYSVMKYIDKINAIQLPNTKIKVLQQLLSQAIDEYKKSQLHYGNGVFRTPETCGEPIPPAG